MDCFVEFCSIKELQSHYEQILRLPDGKVVEGIEVNEEKEARSVQNSAGEDEQ